MNGGLLAHTFMRMRDRRLGLQAAETSVNDRSRRWFWVVPSFALFWAVGLGFAWWIVVPPLIWVNHCLRHRTIPVPAGTAILWSLGGWLLLSLAIGVTDGTTELAGASGAVYAVGVWISAGMLFAVMRNVSTAHLLQMLRGLVVLVAVQGAITTLAVLAWPSPLDTVRFLSDEPLGGFGSLGTWTRAHLAYPAYFGGFTVRSAGMMGAAAWTGGFVAIALLVMLVNRKNLLAAGMRPAFFWLAFALGGASLYFSYSRLSIALALAAGGYLVLRDVMRRLFSRTGSALVMITAVLGFAIVLAYLPWQDYLNEQDSLRPGSSLTRALSYSSAVDAIAQAGGGSVLMGLGDKPPLAGASFGVGSESTYFSLLVRGGLIAVALFVTFLAMRLREAARLRDFGTATIILVTAVHAIAADFDTGTLTLLCLFFTAGRMRVDAPIWNVSAHPPGAVKPSSRR